MAEPITQNLGKLTAYADAVTAGYTGTREQFGAEQANFAANAQEVAENLEESRDVLDDVNTAGTTQTNRVTDEGNTQVARVATAGNTQVGNVNTAGATQVTNVNNAGDTKITAVNTAGTTQVAAVNTAGNSKIDEINAAGAVLYSSQTLADEQKTQSRENIGAASASDVAENSASISELVVGTGINDNVLTPEKSTYITKVNYLNLLDVSKATENYYIAYQGVIEALANYNVSDFIPATPEQIFVMTKISGLTKVDSYIAYYDAMGTKITSKTFDSDEGAYWKVVLPTNANIAYVRFNLGNGDISKLMIVSGSVYPQNYIPYGYFYLQSSNIASAYSNPLYGKILAVDGDSIWAGSATAVPPASAIATKNNMTLDTKAASGGTLKSGTGQHCIATGVATLRADADYYIIEGGVNDGSGDAGSLSTGYDAALDTATLAGAIETVCKTLRETFAGKKCGYVFPHRILADTDGYNTAVRPMIISALEKWGVPYLDLQKKAPPLGLIASLKAAYTVSGDGWHPTTAGYAAFYNDEIEAWMKTL